eukprot:7206891-Pyramimonas_sp.AAC.1
MNTPVKLAGESTGGSENLDPDDNFSTPLRECRFEPRQKHMPNAALSGRSWRDEAPDAHSEIDKGEHAKELLSFVTDMYLSGRWAGSHVATLAWH